MNIDETITAISTPLGEGGLAVIRVSGNDAVTLVDRCFFPAGTSEPSLTSVPTHTLHYGKIQYQGRIVDEVMVAVMRAPRTFTREDVVEISCHGGVLTAKLVLEAVMSEGARLAEPGEFTKRAFLSGRIDLAQAEAVADLIHARTRLALEAANEQLAGSLSLRVNQLRDELMGVLAHVEAHIDFPDEDIAPNTMERLLDRLRKGVEFADDLLRTAPEGQLLRRGIRAAIIGRPNVGKSSLLNLLLGHDRAIVSALPGTTRDTIEETANIREIPVVFIDTAGLRESGDEIEAEGIRRSKQTLQRAELILHVLDASQPASEEDLNQLENQTGKRHIVVCNKIDLPRKIKLPPEVETASASVCCLTGIGLESLKDTIKDRLWSGEIRADMLQVMVNSRHQDALRRAREGLNRTIDALQTGASLELAAMDLRIAVQAVGEIVGKTTTDDLLDSIFSTFCLGK